MTKFNSKSEMLKMVRRYVAGSATKEEIKFLETYYEHFENDEDIIKQIPEDKKQEIAGGLHTIPSMERDEAPVRPLWFSWQRIAAVAIIILSSSLYFYTSRDKDSQPQAMVKTAPAVNDITPGGNTAVLTLSDGTKVNLDEAVNGNISSQSGLKITKQDGKIVYTSIPADASSAGNQFNTIETPRGGEYQIILPDGSKVWLNASSSLRYPTAFTGSERSVELKGEAYFEVVGNKAMPFRVKSNQQVVEVLGTHFNINSYTDESAVKTTLVEGSVKISAAAGRATRILKPGEQSIIKQNASSIKVEDVNVEEFIAWKNGYFLFNNEDIESVMRKISRWYDVDIEYQGNVPAGGFGGAVSKNKNISEVLRILELTKAVHFKVQGRRVIVMS